MNSRRLLAIDPSLTCSGWALFSVSDGTLCGVGKVRSVKGELTLAERLRDLQKKICEIFERLTLSANDVLVCEAPTTMRDPRAAFKVEQVRGIFETVARDRALMVPGRLNPRSVQSEVMGLRGRQLPRPQVKQIAVSVVGTLYGQALESLGFSAEEENLSRNQDIVDAILIGALGLVRLRAAHASEISVEEMFELTRPRGRRRAFG